jgi:hypothetical protein
MELADKISNLDRDSSTQGFVLKKPCQIGYASQKPLGIKYVLQDPTAGG